MDSSGTRLTFLGRACVAAEVPVDKRDLYFCVWSIKK